MSRFSHTRSHFNGRQGFTLIEILAVITIIAILATIVGVGIGGGNTDGARLRNAQRAVSSMLQATRAKAVMLNTDALMLIHADPADPEKFLRYIGIVYMNDDGDWVAANAGSYLPDKVWIIPNTANISNDFDISSSTGDVTFDISEFAGADFRTSDELLEENMVYSTDGTSGTAFDWMWIGFNSRGQAITDGTLTSSGINGIYDNSAAKIMVGVGRQDPDLMPVFTNPLSSMGFHVLRSGRAFMLNNYDDYETETDAP